MADEVTGQPRAHPPRHNTRVQEPRHGHTVGSYGVAVSYERGTLVTSAPIPSPSKAFYPSNGGGGPGLYPGALQLSNLCTALSGGGSVVDGSDFI